MLIRYQKAAARTIQENLTQAEHWRQIGLGWVGEAGEIADIVKKMEFHGHGKSDLDLTEEWHNGTFPHPLHEHLGIPKEKYGLWLRDPNSIETPAVEFRNNFRDEFGDVLWYLAYAATIIGADLEYSPYSYEDCTVFDFSVAMATYAGHVQQEGVTYHGLGRLVTMTVVLLVRYGFTLQEVLDGNIAKLQVRYPDGFSEGASRRRG
jgi:NTP pyrophosphatase (non-canonical NTP hydrolase)